MDGVRSRDTLGALIGVLTAAVAVGVGELVAAFVRPAAAPVIAVGNRLIVLTPESAKQTGIRAAGTNDKLYLLIGIYLLLAVFGAIVGVAALHRLAYGLAGVAVFGAFGTYCALTAPAAQVSDIIPTVVATLAAAGVLYGLVQAAGGDATAPDPPAPDRRALLCRPGSPVPPWPRSPGSVAGPPNMPASTRPTNARRSGCRRRSAACRPSRPVPTSMPAAFRG